MIFLKIFAVLDIIVYNYAACYEISSEQSKKMLPFFRRTVEETEDDSSSEDKMDDPQSQLVSYLVKNVKEIFSDVYEDQGESKMSTEKESTLIFRPTEITSETLDFSTGKSLYYSSIDNLHFDRSSNTNITSISHITTSNVIITENTEASEKKELLKLSKDASIIKSVEQHEKRPRLAISYKQDIGKSLTRDSDLAEDEIIHVQRRLCIYCNNVNFADCVDPKNKLMPSIFCENEGDLCYSQHTPFGIIDRGCFNMKHNMSTYVCSCNLCNHFPISEMPRIFNDQADWVEDVIEMSNTKGFRRSIFKSMSCLKCEVNTTVKVDMLNDANCLEGNIGSVPIEDCNEDEVCAIETITSIGYIKRGCVKKPLYNYWLTLCDNDLCNYEPLASVY